MSLQDPDRPVHKGRGATSNRDSRYHANTCHAEDDGWYRDECQPSPQTRLQPVKARSIIARNRSPDIPFEQSINPYQGCEHGCIYCFARPTHAYWDLSPGLDFETRILCKPDAPELLEAALASRRYQCRPIAFGTNTDPYQPAERELRIMRRLLEVLLRHRHPLGIVTKSALILRDADLLEELARHSLVHVMVSVTTLQNELKRTLEPRTASPAARLRTLRELHERGIPVGVMAAPMIPALNDMELEQILEAARDAGASSAGYILLRLPLEVAELFEDWLQAHYPQRAAHVMSLVRQSRGGRNYDAAWGQRMRGSGVFADLLEQRFRKACRRLGLDRQERRALDVSLFRHDPEQARQASLF